MKASKKDRERDEKKTLLTFIRQTKSGKYAEINENSLSHCRVAVMREDELPERNSTVDHEEYYYSFR